MSEAGTSRTSDMDFKVQRREINVDDVCLKAAWVQNQTSTNAVQSKRTSTELQ